ncbi:hypothetical protein AAC387_Pa07g3634 [Persea americana]
MKDLEKFCEGPAVVEKLGKIIWTRSMLRLYFLVERCYKMREPVLLVGETGGGKTTICQLLSMVTGSRLRTLNCHMYTETSDFVGGFYPVRDRSRLTMEFKDHVEKLKQSKIFLPYQKLTSISSDIEQASSTLSQLNEVINDYSHGVVSQPDLDQGDFDALEQVKRDLQQLQQQWQTLFQWKDGPLVEVMTEGGVLLVDEISLADDSVLERLNSVLEQERKLRVTHQGGKFSVSRYINSFPFPYYVVLKNIESLPRTMADLLRQWFELMQSSGD